MNEAGSDWKLKLRYGHLKTDLSHFTVMADGVVEQLSDGFSCRAGRAWMAMKAWAEDAGGADQLIRLVAEQVGFAITGDVLVYDTEPKVPPTENPHGYDINFTPYE